MLLSSWILRSFWNPSQPLTAVPMIGIFCASKAALAAGRRFFHDDSPQTKGLCWLFFFLSFVFSCPSSPFLPPTLESFAGKDLFPDQMSDLQPQPPALHSQSFGAEGTGKVDLIPVWRTGFSHGSFQDLPGRHPVSAPGWRASSSWNSMEAQLSKALLKWSLPCKGAVRDGAGWLPAPRLCPCAGNGIQDTLESCAQAHLNPKMGKDHQVSESS